MHNMSNKSADTWNIMKLNNCLIFSKPEKQAQNCAPRRYDAVWCSEAVAMTDGPSVWSLWLIKMILFILAHEDFSTGAPPPCFILCFILIPPSHGCWHHSWEALFNETTMRTTSRNHWRTLSGHPAGSVRGTNWRTFFTPRLDDSQESHCSIPVCSRCLPLAIHIKIVGLGVLVKEVKKNI